MMRRMGIGIRIRLSFEERVNPKGETTREAVWKLCGITNLQQATNRALRTVNFAGVNSEGAFGPWV